MKRLTSILLGLAVVFPLHSCAVQKSIPRQDVTTHTLRTRFAQAPGHPVAGYTTTDNVRHAFKGNAWIEGDSMVFHRAETEGRMEAIEPEQWQRVALTDLVSVEGLETDTGRTTMFVIGMTALAAGIVLGGMAAAGSDGAFGW
jgi:hypothetical protein